MVFIKFVIFKRCENLLRMYITIALKTDQSFSYYLVNLQLHSQKGQRFSISNIYFDLLYSLVHREEEILQVIHYQKGSERLVLLGNTNIKWDLVSVFVFFLTAQTFCVTTHEKQSLSIIEIFRKYQRFAEIQSPMLPVLNLTPIWTLVNTKQFCR